MYFIVIFGPPAVGKMTVGYELAHITGFKLLHNHMTIDLVLNFFPFGHPQFDTLVGELRRRILEEVAASDLPGLLFTYVWALDDPRDTACIEDYISLFRTHDAHIYFVELEADQAERLKRNSTAFRLAHKPSKRDIAQSQQNLLDLDERYQLNSNGDFFYQENHLKINTTLLSAGEVASIITTTFRLPVLDQSLSSNMSTISEVPPNIAVQRTG